MRPRRGCWLAAGDRTIGRPGARQGLETRFSSLSFVSTGKSFRRFVVGRLREEKVKCTSSVRCPASDVADQGMGGDLDAEELVGWLFRKRLDTMALFRSLQQHLAFLLISSPGLTSPPPLYQCLKAATSRAGPLPTASPASPCPSLQPG